MTSTSVYLHDYFDRSNTVNFTNGSLNINHLTYFTTVGMMYKILEYNNVMCWKYVAPLTALNRFYVYILQIYYFLHTNDLQMRAAMTHFNSTRPVTRFTRQSELIGSQQSTDVCLTTPDWPSLTTTFDNTSPALCCQTMSKRGLD